MMERMREGVSSIWVKIILALIILSFVLTGVGGYLASSDQPAAAKIDGEEISQAQFEQAYQNERNRMQSQLGDYFTTLMGDPGYVQQFRRSVLDRLVNDALIEQRANALGLRISDDQVKQAIRAMPEFQRDGQFDNDAYNAILRRSRFTPDQFAEYMRTDLLRQQLLTAIQSSDFALSHEVAQLQQLEQQQREVRSLTLDLETFKKGAEISEEDSLAYYEEHAEQFMRPEQVKVSYIELSADTLKQTIEVNEEALETFYQESLAKYTTPEQRRVRLILIQGDDAQAKEKADAILAELKDGADFATLAQTKSEDTFSAKQGGDLGWYDRGVMDAPLDEALFALKNKGDISDVVKSELGYHIIQLEDVKAPHAKPLADVRDELLADLRDQNTAEAFYNLKAKLDKIAFDESKSLEPAAKAINGKVQTTDFFSLEEADGVLATPAVLQALNSPEVRDDSHNSELIDLGAEHVIVVRVDDYRPEELLAFEDVSDQVHEILAAERGEAAAEKLADDMLVALRKGDHTLLENNDLSFSEPEKLSRRGNDPVLVEKAFSMPKPDAGQTVFDMTHDQQGNVVIIALDKVTEPELDAVKANDPLADQLAQMNAQQDVMALLDVLRADAKVTYSVSGETAQ
ncbi:peptidylprolyl isomerase [Photobacterium sp. 1_MG-2023]|uniref:peptidylprolyl isomerase n=1 Tax=Photobacterium sp. 1_MG-2023 TaxID=3062646 RepID=UPI0026E3C5FE|nr:peptidylprolyl isomerase [Photobacterium sp. 1_MG-2023]MDO6707132.1 peptidylprolyl isomerase [Photobacterium sp. 1_MG-2023]